MPHFSALTWRILAFNALALIVFTGGVMLVQASGRGLVEERLNSIQEQANIVAGTLAEYATEPETHTLKVAEAEPLLLSGYEGLKQREGKIPAAGSMRPQQALQRLVQLYEETGRHDQAVQWKKLLAPSDPNKK